MALKQRGIALVGFISRILQNELWVAFLRTSLARGIAASGSLLLGIVLGRLYGAEGVGVFALAQSFLFGVGILARFGMDNALMRFVGMHYQAICIETYLGWALRRALGLAILAALLLFMAREWLAQSFGQPELAGMLAGVAIAVPAFTLTYILSGFMKGIRCPAAACFLESGYVSLLASLVILVYVELSGSKSLVGAGIGLAVAAWLVLLQGGGLYWLLHVVKGRLARSDRDEASPVPSVADKKKFLGSSRAFFVMSLAEFMQNVLSVLAAGMLLSSFDLGLFKAAERAGLLIGFILMIIAAIFPPRFAEFYHRGDHQPLIQLARKSALAGAVMASPLLLACLLVPEWILLLFGPEFEAASNYLRIIAIAQWVNVSTAAVGFLLNMAGYEALMRNISLFSCVIGLVAFLVLIPVLGAMGAALSLALMLVLQNLVALVFVRRKLGFWVYPAAR